MKSGEVHADPVILRIIEFSNKIQEFLHSPNHKQLELMGVGLIDNQIAYILYPEKFKLWMENNGFPHDDVKKLEKYFLILSRLYRIKAERFQ